MCCMCCVQYNHFLKQTNQFVKCFCMLKKSIVHVFWTGKRFISKKCIFCTCHALLLNIGAAFSDLQRNDVCFVFFFFLLPCNFPAEILVSCNNTSHCKSLYRLTVCNVIFVNQQHSCLILWLCVLIIPLL